MAEDINQSDPDYGLPEVSLTPIERGGLGRRKGTVRSTGSNTSNQSGKSKAPLIVTLLFIFLVIVAAFWYFLGQDMFNSGQADQQADQVESTPADNQDDLNNSSNLDGDNTSTDDGNNDFESTTDTDNSQDNFDDADQPDDDVSDSGLVTAGSLNIVDAPTGRTYVIVGSFFDEDLARDYGAKLGKKGVSTSLIMPYGNKKFYRLSVEDFASITEAVNGLDALKEDYGNSLWVIKY